jgi:hypothetical protein
VYVTNLAIGDVVTFSSENQAERHVPLHPKIIKLRADVSWKEIVSQFFKDAPSGTSSLYTLPFFKRTKKTTKKRSRVDKWRWFESTSVHIVKEFFSVS